MSRRITGRGTRLFSSLLALLALAPGLTPDGSAAAAPQAKAPALVAAPPPIALSDPDGQELILDELSIRAAVHGMLSLTELELRFRNPQARRMEGRFSCTLPAGAAISRFAKEVDGKLMEGEVVERLKANQVYDEILHQMRDPALLEQDQGNRFSARIFPIEAHATVRLVLSYSRLLPLEDGVRVFSVPLRGLPTVGRFRLHGVFAPLPGEEQEERRPAASGISGPASARTGRVETLEMDEARYTPKEDVVVRWRPTGAREPRLLTAGGFFVAAFRPNGAPPAAAAGPRSWVFFVDTSASGADGLLHRGPALAALLAGLPAADPVEVVAFDQEVKTLGRGTAGEWARRIDAALKERGFLGGTDLEAALGAMAAHARSKPGDTLVLVSDGVATLGGTKPAELVAAAAKIPSGTPLHALVLGSRQDEATLASLTAGRGRVVEVPFTETMREEAARAAKRLALPLGPAFTAAAKAAEWVYPAVVNDVQAGSEVLVLGKQKAGADPEVLLEKGGKPVFVAREPHPLPSASFGPLLEREAYRAYLGYLASREAAESSPAVREALATEQVKVSVERRIVIPRTTLLVLETEADYRRFGLDRRALTAILTVGPGGLERLDRTAPVFVTRAPEQPAAGDTLRPASGLKKEKAQEEGRREVAAKSAGAATRPSSLSETDAARPVQAPAAAERPAPRRAGNEVGAASGSGVVGGLARDAAPAQVPAPAPVASSTVARADRDERETKDRPAGPAPAEPLRTAPSSPARIVPPPTPVPTERKVTRPDWTNPPVPTDARTEELLARVKAEPSRRELYNEASEALFARKEWKRLRDLALAWQPHDPENPQVYECLGEAALALGRTAEAQRAFGSLVEVAPGKPELLQRAGLLLFRSGAKKLAETPLRRALELRPDRPNPARHLALVLWQSGRPAEAASVLEEAAKRSYQGWYGNAVRVIREELAYVLRDWLSKEPKREAEIRRRAAEAGADLVRTDAVRFTLAWETDANDVDLHVVDPAGEECFYGHRATAQGLELYEDITRGFGPEVVRAARTVPGTYTAGVNYFSAGPMGVSRGVLVVTEPGAGGGSPTVRIVPFRLVPGGPAMRVLAKVGTEAARITR